MAPDISGVMDGVSAEHSLRCKQGKHGPFKGARVGRGTRVIRNKSGRLNGFITQMLY